MYVLIIVDLMDSSLAFDIVETARLIRREVNRRVVVAGSTRAQWRVISRLSRSGDGLRQVELADSLDMEPITLCRVIDRLEDAALVERRRDPTDRRAWRIYLTDKAQPIIDEISPVARQFEVELAAGLTAEEHATLVGLTAKLRANLAAMENARTAGVGRAS